MNTEMAYLVGMILGNGEVQRGDERTTITIDIPHKNLIDDEGLDVSIYVKASLADIRAIIEPLLDQNIICTQSQRSTKMSFTIRNQDYTMREIMRLIGNGAHHSTMTMNEELFSLSTEVKKEIMRGIADVTGYIRASNIAYGMDGHHRVYIEIPGNWDLTINVANMLKDLDVPVQTIDFGHPNFRDSKLKKYNEGKPLYWKKEHQIKVYANEFLPIGFNIFHKRRALEKYAKELLMYLDENETHRYYWEKPIRRKHKPSHPAEYDDSLPAVIRGKHFESWTDLAKMLGYHE